MRRNNTYAPVLEPSSTRLKKAVWKLKAPRKLKHFLWQALSRYLATAEKLKSRHCTRDSSCVRSGAEVESINHTLFESPPPALQCWALFPVPTAPGFFPCQSLYANLDYLLFRAKQRGVSAQQMLGFLWTIWYIWKDRNEKVLNNKDILPLDTIQIASQEAESWKLAQCVEEITGLTTKKNNRETLFLHREKIGEDGDVRWTSPGKWTW